MADIPYDAIVRRIEDGVESHGEFDGAEAPGEVASDS